MNFSSEIGSALTRNILGQGFLLLITGMILDGGFLNSFVMVAAAFYWISILPILLRRPKTSDKFELGLIRIGFVCFLPLSPFSMPLWGWLRELIK